jgi:hypothetical protein
MSFSTNVLIVEKLLPLGISKSYNRDLFFFFVVVDGIHDEFDDFMYYPLIKLGKNFVIPLLKLLKSLSGVW